MPRSFFAFAIATLAPLPLLFAGAIFGGWAIWIALFYIAFFIAGVDAIAPAKVEQEVSEDTEDTDILSILLAAGHFLLLPLCIWSLSGAGVGLFSLEGVALFLAAGQYFGQVSNSNAHELIHRAQRHLHNLGVAIYVSLLFGHHASAHRLVHHTHVGTPNDPNTSRLNESLWRYIPRAWIGSFQAGLAAERTRLRQKQLSDWHPRNPYLLYIGGAFLALAISYLIAGPAGIAVHIALAGYAQLQLLLSDYVQHYGLMRQRRSDGSYEAVSVEHSWNAPHWLSSLWMLNAPRHSDHHTHPGKTFPTLTLSDRDDIPMLPHALPVMAAIAFWPRLWKKIMNPRVAALRNES